MITLLVLLTTSPSISALTDESLPPVLTALVQHVQDHRDGRAPWSLDFAPLDGDRSALPIGVFDSGIGGLTVLEAVLKLDAFNNDTLRPGADGRPDFAGERFIYFGDQANMPYGNYPAQGRTELLRELILKDAVFLLGARWRPAPKAAPRYDKPPVKAIVIACNTATAYGLEDIRAALKAWKLDIPVIGVVEAGARDVAANLPDDGKARAVAVLATVGTCASQAYPKAIGRATGQAGKRAPAVVQQGSVGLAGAIEGNQAFITEAAEPVHRVVPYQGPARDNPRAPIATELWEAYHFSPAGFLGSAAAPQLNSIPNYARYDVITLLDAHRRDGGPPIGAVVLGCTHFPLARTELAEAFQLARTFTDADGTRPYASVVAGNLRFIDPAESTARELFRDLAHTRLRNKASHTPPTCRFFVSVPDPQAPGIQLAGDGSLEPKYKGERKTGRFDMEDTVVVPLTARTLPDNSARLVRALPTVWRQLGALD